MAGSFVMQTPLASCLIQMSALSFSSPSLSQPLPHPFSPPPASNNRSTPVSPSFSSPSKSSLREEGASRPEAAEAGLSLGGQPAPQCMGLFPGPTKSTSYSNVTIRPPDPQGGSLWLRLRVVGSRWWFNSSGRGKKKMGEQTDLGDEWVMKKHFS